MGFRFFTSLLGFVFGCLVPLLVLFFRAYSSQPDWWNRWLSKEWRQFDAAYAVIGCFSVGLFSLVGFFLGRYLDSRDEESKRVQTSNLSLTELASTDGLTGLLNARALHERLDIEIENAFRSPLACLLVDVDHFKRINDTHGHPFGDEVLVQVALILKNAIRGADAAGRLGGEEFLVLLPHTPGDRGMQVAERIRRDVEGHPFVFENNNVAVTVSIGVVSYPSEEFRNREGLLKAVDEALYKAKKTGRNRIIQWASA